MSDSTTTADVSLAHDVTGSIMVSDLHVRVLGIADTAISQHIVNATLFAISSFTSPSRQTSGLRTTFRVFAAFRVVSDVSQSYACSLDLVRFPIDMLAKSTR